MFFTKFAVRNCLRTLKYSIKRVKYSHVRCYNDIAFEDIPEVSATQIRRTLKSHNISFEDGYTCFIAACPICHKGGKSTPSKVYINKITGSYICPSCKLIGQWKNLETYITTRKTKKAKEAIDLNIANELEKLSAFIKNVHDGTSLLKQLPEESIKDVWDKFKLPVVSLGTIENIPIRIDETRSSLYFPLENVESEIVGYRIVNRKKNKAVTEPSINCDGLLTSKPTKCKDTAILVPNIADFLVLINSKASGCVICLPNGLINLPHYVLPTLEKFSKLILWFGNDFVSWDSARLFAKKLNEKRCLFVRPTDKNPLPHTSNVQDFKAIIASAQPIWHKSITTFSSLREDVLSDLQNIDKVQGIKWKRFPTLNRILKGHRRGELTVITGPTGCGKTTFISEYSLDLAIQGVSTLWGSFEIRNARLARTMLQQMAELPLESNLDKFDTFADEFEKLPVYFMTFHGQQSVKIVMEAVDHASYVHDITHVIIDNVQFMMGITEEQKHMDRFWKQDAIIAAFRTFATRKNCHVTLVIHPRKERDDEDLTTSSIFGGAKASQEADNVFIIQDKRLTSVRGKRYLQVAKNRYTGDLGIMPLDFDKASLSYSQKKKKTVKDESEEIKSDFVTVEQ